MVQILQQYSKQISVLMVLIAYLVSIVIFNKYLLKDNELKKWFLGSLSDENGNSSGKSLTAFILVKILAFSTIVAVIYAPNHLLPEYFLFALLTFIASLYGIRLASKYFNSSGGTSDNQEVTTNTNTDNTNTNDNKINNPDDVG